ncbi:MAG: hypothetical protein GSR80_001106 [Desulfurococcales archaeon]|nr:hypothetical protein [Desulfurococcales archaeon]
MIVEYMKESYKGFDVDRLWYTPPERMEDALYRQEVFSDLEDPGVLSAIRSFVAALSRILSALRYAEEHSWGHQREGIFLDAVLSYCEAVSKLLEALRDSPIRSRGLLSFREYLEEYVASEGCRRLKDEAERVASEITSLSFCMDVKGSTITVYRDCEGEEYDAFLEGLFERFREVREGESSVAEPRWELAHTRGHVENAILDLVARIYREPFDRLSRFYNENKGFIDEAILRFYREIQFYLSYLEFIAPLRKAGLPFTLPRLKREDGEEYCIDCFDLALAIQLLREGRRVVTNDFQVTPEERILVVTGPNSGGKTTFARMIGQAYYLAKLGVPIPGREAELFFVDGVYTHFPRGEDVEGMHSKLEEDLTRIKLILDKATSKSVIILNEPFSSTTAYDAALLGRRVIERILEIGSRCVYVTFIDELARLEHVASYVAQVDPRDPEIRTYKILRQPANGLAYARLIAKKYRLTYEDIVSRVVG